MSFAQSTLKARRDQCRLKIAELQAALIQASEWVEQLESSYNAAANKTTFDSAQLSTCSNLQAVLVSETTLTSSSAVVPRIQTALGLKK